MKTLDLQMHTHMDLREHIHIPPAPTKPKMCSRNMDAELCHGRGLQTALCYMLAS